MNWHCCSFFVTLVFFVVNANGIPDENRNSEFITMSRNDFHEILLSSKMDMSAILKYSKENLHEVLNDSKENMNKIIKLSENLFKECHNNSKNAEDDNKNYTLNLEKLLKHSNVNYQNVLKLIKKNQLEMKEHSTEIVKLKTELEDVNKELQKNKNESINLKMKSEKLIKNCENTLKLTEQNQMELKKQCEVIEENVNKSMSNWKMEIEEIIEKIENRTFESKENNSTLPNNCDDLFKMGKFTRGVEKIYPYVESSVDNFTYAFCEYLLLDDFSGGWTVIQRRNNVTVRENFKRNWSDYVHGFGETAGEYWIGLNVIHALTNHQPMQLRIILEDWQNKREVINYKSFSIDDESNKFQLHLHGFSGNIKDSLAYHNNMYFTTIKNDNDNKDDDNCAEEYNGGWWYNECYYSNLNGLPYPADKKEDGGIEWYGFNPNELWKHPLRTVAMMIKPL